MTEKEFRKLRSLDLIQILLTQSNEETRLQEELDRQKEHLDGLRAHNESLKTALNDKDALIETLKQDLNQSDAAIRDLREELKTLYTDKRIDLENIGSLTEVAKRVNQIFELAQREAEEYLAHPERVSAIEENIDTENIVIEENATPENISIEENIDSENIVIEKSMDSESIIIEENAESESIAIEENTEPEDFAIEKRIDPENIVTEKALEKAEKMDPEGEMQTGSEDTASDEVVRNHGSSVIDSAGTDDIKVEVAKKELETIADTTPETEIFETSKLPEETASAEAEVDAAEETAGSSIEEVVTAEAEEGQVGSVTPDPAVDIVTAKSVTADMDVDSKTDAKTAEGILGNADTAENITAETDVKTTAAATDKHMHVESHPGKTTPKHSHPNKGLFRKLIGGRKREKGGR